MIRTVPTPTIRVAGARVRLSRRLASKLASSGISAAHAVCSNIKECPLADVLGQLEDVRAILDVTGSAIGQIEDLAAELERADRLLKTGELDGPGSPLLSCAETIYGHTATLRALDPEIDLPEVDDISATVAGLAAALRADAATARGRAEKIEGAAQRAAATALARSDTSRTARKAILPVRDVLAYPVPPELQELIDGLPLYKQAETARVYIEDQRAARDAVVARRKDSERQHIADELGRLWA